MQTKTFSGQTPAEALSRASSELGDDVLVIKTTEIRKPSISQEGLYEVIVCVEEEPPKVKGATPKGKHSTRTLNLPSNIKRKPALKRQKPAPSNGEDILELSSMMEEIRSITGELRDGDDGSIGGGLGHSKGLSGTIGDSAPPRLNPISSKIDGQLERHKRREMINNYQSEELKNIRESIEVLDDRMKLMQNAIWLEKTQDRISLPQEFAEIYRLIKKSGVLDKHLDPIMKLSVENMPSSMRSNSELIKRYFQTLLRKMIACRMENLKPSQKKIMMFVGPTGVGKTTTIAKLAARYSLEYKLKVGIITLDNYRIGGFEQLSWYANKMVLPFELASGQDELETMLSRMQNCNYILIDTAGHSPNDKAHIDVIKSYAQSDFKIDTSLVLSATTKFEDLREIYEAFASIAIDTIIFSKLDETNSFGSLFSLLYEVKKPLSYVSTGQEVPNDIEVASSEYLVNCILNGFNSEE